MTTKNFYKNCLTEDLREQVNSQLSKLMPEQLSLNEEVAIHKARCADAVKAWSEARKTITELEKKIAVETDETSLKDLRQALKIAYAYSHSVGENMADVMKLHKDMVVSAATTDTKTRELVTQNTLMLLIGAVLDLAHEYFNKGTSESIKVMSQFEDELRQRVIIKEAEGQELAVEAEFWSMMETVPQEPALIE